jgi:hypothetical protein
MALMTSELAMSDSVVVYLPACGEVELCLEGLTAAAQDTPEIVVILTLDQASAYYTQAGGDLALATVLANSEEPAIVLSVDNRRVASNTGRTVQPLIELLSLEVEEKMSSDERAAVLTRAAGSHGMTVKELCDMTGWNQCRAAAALSRAHRKRGWLTCSGEFRESCGAYVATEYWSTDRVRELLARFESEAPVEAEVFNLDDAPALIG